MAQQLAAFRLDAAEHLLSALAMEVDLQPADVETLGKVFATLPTALGRALAARLGDFLRVLRVAEVRDLADRLLRLPAEARGGPAWPIVLDAATAIVQDGRLAADARRALVAALVTIAASDPRGAAGEVCAAAQALATLDRALHRPFAHLALQLARRDATAGCTWLGTAPGVLSSIAAEQRAEVLAAAQAAGEQHSEAPLALLRSSAAILRTAGRAAWEAWLAAGREFTGYAALAYYRRQSRRSVAVLRAVQPALALGDVQHVLARYCVALAGQPVEVVPAADGVATLRAHEQPGAELRVFLPPAIALENGQPEPFVRYKVMATHQVAHLEFGTHGFVYERPARYFASWRPPGLTGGLDVFFALFPDPSLARAVFVAVEDARVDAWAMRQYRGLADAYCTVRRGELRARPPIDSTTSPRAALYEALIRLSLGGTVSALPSECAAQLPHVRRVLRIVERPGATVEDAAEGTLRLYPLFAALPGPAPGARTATTLQADELSADLHALFLGRAPGAADDWTTAVPRYRHHEDPRLDQALVQARAATESGGVPLTEEELRQLLERGMLDLDLAEGEEPSDSGLFVTELLKKPPVRLRARQAERTATGGPAAPPRPVTPRRARRFVYDEWDFRAGDYRPGWCQLFEQPMEESDDDFVAATLRAYPEVAEAIRRHIVQIRPHQLAKRRGFPEGEDLDLDAAIERVVALRSRRDPPDRVFWQRQRLERDVAVALLLDMSASTDAEVLTPNGSRRIIDLAKESLALLCAALDSVGDRYGVYGFSGYGRENVEYYVIKEIDERSSPAVGRRIASIRPLRSTRMGPAIRHATMKLQRSGAQMRLLLLLSDGYPQDHDYYGLDRLERDYALHDTRMALLEARRRGIVPFCLTVDQAGYDYLRTMCAGLGYEVVRDLATLPERLGALYAQLTR